MLSMLFNACPCVFDTKCHKEKIILGKGSPRWVCQAVPVGGVSEEAGQDVTQQCQGDLMGV